MLHSLRDRFKLDELKRPFFHTDMSSHTDIVDWSGSEPQRSQTPTIYSFHQNASICTFAYSFSRY